MKALALDVGGTFTDDILADGSELRVAQTLSTPAAPAAGFFNGVERVLALSGAAPEETGIVLHGSTVATNAILEGKGARTGMLTTAGFRHMLEIGRAEIPRAANLFSWVKPSGRCRRAASSRSPSGCTATARSPRPWTRRRWRVSPPRSAGSGSRRWRSPSCTLTPNPAHERRAAETLGRLLPEQDISISSDVLPVFRGYERAMATALNAPAPAERPEPSGERLAALDGAAPDRVPVYRREALLAGHAFPGPAIIDQLDTTTLVLPGQAAQVDRFGNLLIEEAP